MAMDGATEVLHDVTAVEIVFLHANEMPRCRARVAKAFGYHTLQLMTRGAVRLWYGDESFDMRGRWAWPAGPGHGRVAFGPATDGGWWHHRYAAFAGRLADRWRDEGLMPRSPQPLSPAESRDAASALGEAIAQVNRPPSRWQRLRAANALERALLVLAEARASPALPDRPAWLADVLDRLADAEGPEVDLAAEADRLATGHTTLRRQVRDATGMPPHAYRLSHKLAAARRLLAETDAPVKAVAARLGYHDVYHFSRHFSRGVGVPPAAFRRSRQGGTIRA